MQLAIDCEMLPVPSETPKNLPGPLVPVRPPSEPPAALGPGPFEKPLTFPGRSVKLGVVDSVAAPNRGGFFGFKQSVGWTDRERLAVSVRLLGDAPASSADVDYLGDFLTDFVNVRDERSA